MPRLVWDRHDERFWEAGVDMVAIYPHNDDPSDVPVPPFALSGVREITTGFVDTGSEEFWIDGISYHRYDRPETYVASITTFDTPLDVIYLMGYKRLTYGLYAAHQSPRKFDMVFRSLMGSNVKPLDTVSGDFKLHFIWNCLASETEMEFETQSERADLKSTTIDLIAAPLQGGRRLNDTAAVVLDSRRTSYRVMQRILNIVYGSEVDEPRMITLDDLFAVLRDAPGPRQES